jgi:hypothetical protein
MGKQNTERRVYTREFKAEAVALAEKREKPVGPVAKDLGRNERVLRRWMQQAREAAPGGLPPFPDTDGPGPGTGPVAERKQGGVKLGFTRTLQKNGGHLRAERSPVMAYPFMQKHQKEHSIRELVVLFGVSISASSKGAKQGVSARRSTRDAELLDLIREIVQQHHDRYGFPRVREALRNTYEKRVSVKKVARLLREHGLNARRRGKFIPTTRSNHGLAVCENLLNREFQAETAGAKWVSSDPYGV